MDTYEQVEQVREALRQVAKQVEHLGIALCRPGAEEKPVEPKFEVGDCFVREGDPCWQRQITQIGQDVLVYQYWGRHGADEAVTFARETLARQLASGEWLSIPPKPDVPEGIRLTGEVRVPVKGEWWINVEGILISWDGPPNIDLYGGRRWIAEEEPEHWQDAYAVCPKCREAVEVPEDDSVMFECGAWQRRDGVFVPSLHCLQNQADQLKAAQESPHA